MRLATIVAPDATIGVQVLVRVEIEVLLTLAEDLYFGRTAQRLWLTHGGSISRRIDGLCVAARPLGRKILACRRATRSHQPVALAPHAT